MSKRKTTHTTKGLRPPKKHSSKHAVKVYWPYIPLLVLLLGGMVLNGLRTFSPSMNGSTLAYATEMSRGNLLSSTNARRASNGVSGLTINSKLNQAAQNKATDMRNRDYWSHNTPDGEEPWVFIDAVGYAYVKAGENLAYGYPTSDETVTGWMNSPSHRANMLDSAFTEVGFGFVNAENFNSSGNQTIVVAMYAKPYATPALEPSPEPEPTPAESTPEVQSQSNYNPQEQTETVSSNQQEDLANEDDMALEQEEESVVDDTIVASSAEPITSESSDEQIEQAQPVRTTLLTTLTSGNYLWATTFVSLAGFTLSLVWIMKHAVAVRKIIITGEHFVAHHPVFDLLVVAVVLLAVYLTQGNGVVL